MFIIKKCSKNNYNIDKLNPKEYNIIGPNFEINDNNEIIIKME
jgi:hypothetical protein